MFRRRIAWLSMGWLLWGCTGVAAAQSVWSEFRGASGQGLAPNAQPPISWDGAQGSRWRTEVPGGGWSSPVIRSQRIYLTSAVVDPDNDAQLGLVAYCFDFASGKLLWEQKVFEIDNSATKHDKNTHASPTPVVTSDRLFVHFGPSGTACLDLSGNLIWKQDSLSYNSVHGSGGSPVLVDGQLIYHADGSKSPAIIALDAGTGAVAWRRERETEASRKFSFSTPLPVEQGGQVQLVSPASGAVFGYSAESGEELWRVDYGQGYSVVPRPVGDGERVFVATGFGRPKVMAIRLGGSGNVTGSHVVWETSRSGPKTPSMVVENNLLYFVSDGGIATCVEADSGEPVWSDRLRGNFSSSPIVADGRLYIGSEEGVLYVVATGRQFKILGENDFEERIFASPAAVGRSLIVRTETHLYRIDS